MLEKKPLDFRAEPYSAFGNISASGIGKILGTPNHDRLRTVIRETVQNSWDARLDNSSPVLYRAHLRRLDPEQRSFLRSQVFAELPRDPQGRDELLASLEETNLRVLEISDFGTTGLGGPVRANVVGGPGESTDFVDFVRNIGSPRDKEHGGGTYGYGKSSLYRLSRCRTVCIHTSTRYEGQSQSRFIVCRLGSGFQSASAKYTGRQWWGRLGDDEVIDPILDEESDSVAAGLSLPERGPSAKGTSLLILDPELEDRDPQQAIEVLRESLLWYFWPKMVAIDGGQPSMRFELMLDGETVEIPALEEYPPLEIFAEAMTRLKQNDDQVIFIECGRPKQLLGKLAISRGPVQERAGALESTDSDIPPRCGHIALMRPAELVVRYLKGPEIPDERIEYGGVFICDDEVEAAFAAAEPPAHDDWIPDNLTGHQKTYVKMALKRIGEALDEATGVRKQVRGTGGDVPLGAVSESLGDLLIGQSGSGLGGFEPTVRSSRGAGRATTRKSVRVGRPLFERLETVESVRRAIYRVDIHASQSTELSLTGRAEVALDGGGTTSEPEGADVPEIIAWYGADESLLGGGASVRVEISGDTQMMVAVSVPDDCAIVFELTAEEVRS